MSRAEREAAKKEALFREVDERIETVSRNLPPDNPTREVLCECVRQDDALDTIVFVAGQDDELGWHGTDGLVLGTGDV